MTKRAQDPQLWPDPPGSRRTRGPLRRAAGTTWQAWSDARKVERCDELTRVLLYRAADLADDTLDPFADESAYTRAVVLGRVLDVVRFVHDRVAGDADGPTLADLLASMDEPADTGPPD